MKRSLIFCFFMSFSALAFGSTEVELKTPTGVLRGTMEEPTDSISSLVVLIHPGSGPTDRDGNSALIPGKNDSLKLLAEQLSSNGIASLRIDKRGIGGSREAGIKEENLRFETYVDDVIAWNDYLKNERKFKQTVMLGHSEGALVGLVAANKSPVAAYISIGGSSKRASALMREQLKGKLSPELLHEATVILQQLDQGRTVSKISPDLALLFRPSAQPYLISWIQYTPIEELAKLDVPALILQGTTDIQVSPTHAEGLHASKPDATLVVLEGMNHLLKEVKPDMNSQIASFSDSLLPLHPELIPSIVSFLKGLPEIRE